MRKMLLACALALPMAACSFETPPTVTAVQEYAKTICSFLPAATSVSAMILASADPSATATSAFGIAQAICVAINSSQATVPQTLFSSKAECPKVNGVCVEGERIK